MKNLTLIVSQCIILFVLISCNSNNIKTNNVAHHTDNIKSNSFQQTVFENIIEIDSNDGELSKVDLAKFAASLGDARIIGLGEQTHGAGSIFTLKTQLIKYLHQYHDFDVFILESGMFDVNKIWQQALKGKRIKNIAADNIFYMYAKTAEVTSLFDYINQQALSDDPLILVGFDSQHTGGISNQGLVDALTLAVVELTGGINHFTQWPNFAEQIQQVLNVNKSRLNFEEEALFFKQLVKLQQIFKADNQFILHNSAFWHRITVGLEAQAKRQWGIADSRSKEMGENIKYWAEQYPDKKIVVWAHTWHLTRNGNYQVNAGQVVANTYGEKYFMAHFTGAEGEYLDFVTMKNKKIIIKDNNMIEKSLNTNMAAGIGFINLRELDQSDSQVLNNPSLIFANDYQQTLPIKQSAKFFDGVFFMKKIAAANFKN